MSKIYQGARYCSLIRTALSAHHMTGIKKKKKGHSSVCGLSSVDNKLVLFYCSNRDPLFVELINYALNKLENSNNENITMGATHF